MKSKQRVSVKKERNVITYAEMWHTSLCLLERGQEQVKASTHQFRASLVFTAFTLEAYLNHVGRKLFDCWEDLERLLRPQQESVLLPIVLAKAGNIAEVVNGRGDRQGPPSNIRNTRIEIDDTLRACVQKG